MTDPEALIVAHEQVERQQQEEWPHRVMQAIEAIENETLAEAGLEVAKLANFALKTKHSDQFNREVRDCVLHFWERCNRERKWEIERNMKKTMEATTKVFWYPLSELPPGFVFCTQNGILAVKSEYHLTGGKSMCILLGSGEYAHFPDGDNTLVHAVEIKEQA